MKYKITYIGGSEFVATNNFVNVDNLNDGHIVNYIQNLILCAYHVDNLLYFYHYCGFPANIAQRLSELLSDGLADNSTKSWIWCPLIWNALNLDNTPETFKNYGNRLTPEQQTYINYYAEKLSEFPGWRDYALNILKSQFSLADTQFDDPNIIAWSSEYGHWVAPEEAATIITKSQINEIKGLINNPILDPYNIKLNYLKEAYDSKGLNYVLSEVENNAFLNILNEKLSEEEYKEFLNILDEKKKDKNKKLEQFLQQKIDIDNIPENIKKQIGIGIFIGEFDELLSNNNSDASIYSIFINPTDISKYIINNIDIVIYKISNNKISDQNFLELKIKIENREPELELSDDEFEFLNQNFLKFDDKQITSSSSSSSSSSRNNLFDPFLILEQFLNTRELGSIPETIKTQIGIDIFIGKFDGLLSKYDSNASIYSIFINPTDISKYIIENHAQIKIHEIYEENLNELKNKLETNDLDLDPFQIQKLRFIISPSNEQDYEEDYDEEDYDQEDDYDDDAI